MASSALEVRANRGHKPTIGQTGRLAPAPPVMRALRDRSQGAGSGKLGQADPVDPVAELDLGVFAIAEIALEDAVARVPAHPVAGTPVSCERGRRLPPPRAALARLARLAAWKP